MNASSTGSSPSSLPAGLHLWWLAATLAGFAGPMLGFALIWSATAHGAGTVALVSTVAAAPQVLLVLLGGAIGDRHGPRSTLLGTTTSRILLLAALLVPALGEPGPGLLVLASGIGAVIAAVHQPSAAVYPRLLVRDPERLARAMARISGSLQIARTLGVAAGGAAVARWSLGAVVGICLVMMLLVLVLLLVLRPAHTPVPARRRQSMLVTIADGLRVARDLRIWPLLAAVALVSGAVLPTVGVALPLLARGRGWTSAQAALLDAGWAAGMLAVTLLVSALGTPRRQRIPMVGGPMLVCSGLLLLALPLTSAAAIAVCGVIGVGTALFTTQMAPLLVRLAPSAQVARFQSLLVLVQLVPPALLNGAFAALAAPGSGIAVLVLAAGMAAGAAALPLAIGPRDGGSTGTEHTAVSGRA